MLTASPHLFGDAVGAAHDAGDLSDHRGNSVEALVLWWIGAALVCGFATVLTALSGRFSYAFEVIEMPVLAATAFLVVACSVFAALLPGLIRTHSSGTASSSSATARILTLVIAAGVLARLILFLSEPVLENDYQRYLWDGAVSASGLNPYAVSPRAVIEAGDTGPLAHLAAESGLVLSRIGHGTLTTIYPPVAQAAFGLAHALAPWSLTAWRAVLLACDAAVLVLLLALLKETNRSPLWAALYWWNPLVIKEGFNSAHMEPLVLVLVMLTLWLAATRKPVVAVGALGFAAGAKIWPVLLLPLLLRPLLNDPRRMTAALAVFGTLMLLWAVPIVSAGLGEHSGILAYAETWQTNSALVPLLQAIIRALSQVLTGTDAHAAVAVRFILAVGLGAIALALAWRPIGDARDLLARAALMIAALVLMSPSQYPWYLMWLAPLLVFWPSRAFLLAVATIPLYYAKFHFAALETLELAQPFILAAIWGPVWGLLAYSAWCRAGNGNALKFITARSAT